MIVDGSFLILGTSGRRGIGGIFRNFEGEVFLQFAKEVCVDSAIHVEILALR